MKRFFVICLFLCVSMPIEAQPLFEVSRFAFCKAVENLEPVHVVAGNSTISTGEPFYFWIEIKGGTRALKMLRARKQMAVFHAWAVGGRVIDIINVGLKTHHWRKYQAALERQVREKGYFTWRTLSMKRNHPSGTWYVSVLDANRKPVRKEGEHIAAFRPQIVLEIN